MGAAGSWRCICHSCCLGDLGRDKSSMHTPPTCQCAVVPAGVVTLPDGNVLIVGGVAHNGQGGWQALPDRRAEYDNPT